MTNMKTNLIALDWNDNVYSSTLVRVNIAYTQKYKFGFSWKQKFMKITSTIKDHIFQGVLSICFELTLITLMSQLRSNFLVDSLIYFRCLLRTYEL